MTDKLGDCSETCSTARAARHDDTSTALRYGGRLIHKRRQIVTLDFLLQFAEQNGFLHGRTPGGVQRSGEMILHQRRGLGCPGSFLGSVLIWNYPQGFSVGGVMIELMGGPFRFNKKARKRLRRFAKKVAVTADKFETEGTKPNGVAILRRLAESNLALAKGRKKKKSKNPI
jgi:hypothetical protein